MGVDLEKDGLAGWFTGPFWLVLFCLPDTRPHTTSPPRHNRSKAKGVKCVINTDAHRNEHAGFLRLGVGIARKGWLTAADVINTLPLPKLRKELAKKRTRKSK